MKVKMEKAEMDVIDFYHNYYYIYSWEGSKDGEIVCNAHGSFGIGLDFMFEGFDKWKVMCDDIHDQLRKGTIDQAIIKREMFERNKEVK